MDERIAHLTCQCGKKFQVLKTVTQVHEDGSETEMQDLDEEATAKAFSEHECK